MAELPPHGPQAPLEPPASRDPHPAAGTAPASVPDLGDIDDVTRDWLTRLAVRYHVPPDLLQLACERAYGTPLQESDDLAEMACALESVLVRHRQMALERKARDLEKYLTGTDGAWDRAINQAVRDLLAPSEPPETARGDSDA